MNIIYIYNLGGWLKINYNIIKNIYEILLKDKLITKEEYDKLIDKLHRECWQNTLYLRTIILY